VAAFCLLLGCAIAMTLAQDAYPGAAVYHTGWYNALNIALFVLAAVQLRALRRTHAQRFPALAAAAFGGAIVVFSGVASGLMGPDTHTVVGAPGASVRDDEVGGSFVFPLQGDTIRLERGRGAASAGAHGRAYTGGFILWEEPRTVLDVQAADLHGNHLTITQPTNASFLSPVLLFRDRQRIGPLSVPFDTFATPAQHRVFRALYFTPADLERFRHQALDLRVPSVVLTAADDAGRPLGITLAV
jgi:hypothetical protein